MSRSEDSLKGPQSPPIRVLVVEDSPVQRQLLLDLLEDDSAFLVVGWAGDGEAAIRQRPRLKPDVIIMDLLMPQMNGVAAARQIMQDTPTPIVVVTVEFTGKRSAHRAGCTRSRRTGSRR